MADPKRDISHEQERLNAPVNPSLAGEDPAVRALAKMPDATNLEALDIALALNQLIRGQASMLDNQKNQGEQIAKLRNKMARMDRAAKKWDEERTKFIEDVNRKADKIRLPEEEREKLAANKSRELSELIGKARAEAAIERQHFDQKLATDPTETVISPGEYIFVSTGGQQQARLIPEEVRIKHRHWTLPPGEPVEVPKIVADFLRQRRRQQKELEARKAALQPDSSGRLRESGQVEKSMAQIDKEYGSSTARLNI